MLRLQSVQILAMQKLSDGFLLKELTGGGLALMTFVTDTTENRRL